MLGIAVLIMLTVHEPATAQPGLLDETFGQRGVFEVDLPEVDVLTALPGADGGFTLLGLFGTDAVAIRVLPDAPGLDPSFGTDGVARVDFGQGFEYASAGAQALDGRIVLAGASADRVGAPLTGVVARLNADGLPDLTFGSGGVFRLPGYVDSRFGAVRSFEDGSVLAVGSAVTFPTATQESEDGVIVVRLTAQGILDATYGDGGVVFSALNRDFNGSTGIIRTDGSAVVAGAVVEVRNGTPDFDAAVVRTLPTGQLDATFGEAGLTVLETPLPSSSVSDVELDSAGRIVGAGLAISGASGSREALVFRLRPDGQPDATFGDAGVVVERGGAPLANADGLAVQADRSVVVIGTLATTTRQDLAVFKFTEAGDLEAGFGASGVARLAVEANGASRGGFLQADGRIVAVGTRFSSTFEATGFIAARLENEGSPVGSEPLRATPAGIRLDLAGPNPAPSVLQVRLTSAAPRDVRVDVYDVAGRVVATLHDGKVAAGETLLRVSEDRLSPGVYVIRAVGEGGVATRKVVRM